LKTFAVSQSNYLPWKGYFDLINNVDIFVLYDTVQYTKNDWRNRNRVVTANGTSWLTVPVIQKSLDQRINEVEIANQRWQRKHWLTIEQSYKKTPFFAKYSPFIKPVFEREWSKLSELNVFLLSELCRLLGISTKFVNAADFNLEGDKNMRLIQIAKELDAQNYLSGPAAKDYIDLRLFKQEGISVKWMDYTNYPVYPQRSSNFEHGVSIIDLLFNVGPNFDSYMQRSVRENTF